MAIIELNVIYSRTHVDQSGSHNESPWSLLSSLGAITEYYQYHMFIAMIYYIHKAAELSLW